MKQLLYLLALVLVAGLYGCDSTPPGTTIRGQLANANGLDVLLDRVQINGANEVLQKATISSSGDFELAFPNGLKPAVYQLRIGAQRAAFSLDGTEGVVNIKGDLTTFNKYDFTVDGSASATEMVAVMKNLNSEPQQLADIQNVVETVKDPRIGAFIAFNTLQRSGASGLPVHKIAVERLPADDPAKATYAGFVQNMEAQIAQMRASELIRVGQPAPNISLESPDGKTYALDDLKGQVVLLDFWASWCGPCRRENPNVVKVYDKYKNDGFTIYSVSLDGLDPRRTNGMPSDQVAQAQKGQKKRWVDAIKKDGLTWPYHVSELRKWDTMAAKTYGVRGIPKTFLIDRDGKIAAVGLRGAASIEQALQSVL